MKKLVFLLAIMFTFVAVQAQVRTLTTKNVSSGNTYTSYKGVTADTLSTNQDTLQITYFVAKDYPMSYVINSTLDTIAGSSTTVVINVYGKVFSDDSWTKIQTATTSAVIASAITKVTFVEPVLVTATDTTGTVNATEGTITNPFTSATAYRYYMIEYIISDDGNVGAGVKLTKLEWKWYYRPY